MFNFENDRFDSFKVKLTDKLHLLIIKLEIYLINNFECRNRTLR